MIRVELGEEVKRRGKWRYVIRPLWSDGGCSMEYVSRTPLLDACRLLKSTGAPLQSRVGLFRQGRDQPDLTCTVEGGAGVYVFEPDHGTIRFAKWNPPQSWGRTTKEDHD